MVRIFFIAVCLLGLAACTGNQYDPSRPENQITRPISIPPGMNSAKIKNYYPVPALGKGAKKEQPSLVPPGAEKSEVKS